jgi:hypothetical protein
MSEGRGSTTDRLEQAFTAILEAYRPALDADDRIRMVFVRCKLDEAGNVISATLSRESEFIR